MDPSVKFKHYPDQFIAKDYLDPTKPAVLLKFAELDGKNVAYTNHTVFYIELGNGPKGKWTI